MRISIPSITLDPLVKILPLLPREAAIERIAEFLSRGNVSVLTGAGVSVDSGIRAYRGRNGLYLNPNYHPTLYHELVDPTAKGYSFRQRYWARSYLGWPAVRAAQPNPTHFALSALQYANIVGKMITQNVDGLHMKATSQLWGPMERESRILELHGKLRVSQAPISNSAVRLLSWLKTVSCINGHTSTRTDFQERIGVWNPDWKAYADELVKTGSEPRTNPDGDVRVI